MEHVPESKSIFHAILPILLCGLAIPLSLFLWIGNIAFTFVTQRPFGNEGKMINLFTQYCKLLKFRWIKLTIEFL